MDADKGELLTQTKDIMIQDIIRRSDHKSGGEDMSSIWFQRFRLGLPGSITNCRLEKATERLGVDRPCRPALSGQWAIVRRGKGSSSLVDDSGWPSDIRAFLNIRQRAIPGPERGIGDHDWVRYTYGVTMGPYAAQRSW